jgi:hypothetical protein
MKQETLKTSLPQEIQEITSNQIYIDETQRTFCFYEGKKFRVKTLSVEITPRKFRKTHFPDISRPID